MIRCHVAASAGDVSAWLAHSAAEKRCRTPWETAAVDSHVRSDRERVVPETERTCVLERRLEYEEGWFGVGIAIERIVRRVVHGQELARAEITRHAQVAHRGPQRILLSGGSGLLGQALAEFLSMGGHEIVRLVRGATTGPGQIAWDPAAGQLDAAQLEGLDAAIALSGEGIGDGRWTEDRKRRIRDSRVHTTGLLAARLAGLTRPPRVLVSASAVGIYGARGPEAVDEAAAPGSGFLAEVGAAWEAAAQPAGARGIRVVHPRLGIVLTPTGGALPRILRPFRAGLGGRLGSGSQVMSWVTLDDVLGAIHTMLFDDSLSGPVNVVAPGAVTNAEFTRVLGQLCKRPTALPVPASVLKLALGEMGQALLLEGVRAVPRKLQAVGYSFRWPELEPALAHMRGKGRLPSARESGRVSQVDI